jgi:hypothetical protein
MGRASFSFETARANSKLTDYPALTLNYGRKISVVGVATQGCQIAYSLSLQCRQLGNFVYVSCDEDDVVSIPSSPSTKKFVFPLLLGDERSPSSVRGVVVQNLEQVKRSIAGSHVVLIVSGLGGTIGSGVAPLIARCAKQSRAMVAGIVTMPFFFEKHKHFFAGCALRQLTENADGIIMLENRGILGSADLSVFDANALLLEKLSLTINELAGPIENDDPGNGVERIVDFIRANPYTVLRVNEMKSTSMSEETNSRSGVLVSYQSRGDVNEIINEYDPIDSCLRKSSFPSNLDPEFDSSIFEFGQGILRNIEA